jgi:hypothetical protein
MISPRSSTGRAVNAISSPTTSVRCAGSTPTFATVRGRLGSVPLSPLQAASIAPRNAAAYSDIRAMRDFRFMTQFLSAVCWPDTEEFAPSVLAVAYAARDGLPAS